MAEQVSSTPRSETTPASSEQPPPPYAEYSIDSQQDTNENLDDEAGSTPIKITVNAKHVVKGQQNVVPPPQLVTAEFAKFAAMFMGAVDQLQRARVPDHRSEHESAADEERWSRRDRRPFKFDFIINYDIQIDGDRNVMGNVAVRPRGSSIDTVNAEAQVGTGKETNGLKRKAEEDIDAECRRLRDPHRSPWAAMV